MQFNTFPSSFLLLPSIILLSILPSKYLCNFDDIYSNCDYFKCGTNNNITYPFWRAGQPHCGHPGFELRCEGSDSFIEIKNEVYKVLDIKMDTQILKIAKMDFYETSCPDPHLLSNTTLDFAIFNYTSDDQNSTLLYNCSKLDYSEDIKFSCEINKNVPSIGYLVNDTYGGHEVAKICEVNVVVTVLKTALDELINDSLNVSEVLNEGFGVRWIIDQMECANCVASCGRCGFDVLINNFKCLPRVPAAPPENPSRNT